MSFQKIACLVCSEELFFRDELLSQYENFSESKRNKKPLEVKTGKVHECRNRGWSIVVKCNHCRGPIRFNNAIKSPRGIKIPHDAAGLTAHVCEVVSR